MRIVANYGTSLLDYINNDKSMSDVLSEKIDDSCLSAAAKKTLEENGISLDGSTTTDTETYSSIQTTADSLREHAALLTGSTDSNIYTEAEESGSTDEVVSEIKDFVTDYNKMLTQMSTMGGDKNTTYASDLSKMVTANEENLKKIGITKNEDGSLSVDEDTLSSAELSDLKTAFAGSTSFADSVAKKSVYVQANAISAMYTSTISNYTSSGTYSDSTLSSFLQSI